MKREILILFVTVFLFACPGNGLAVLSMGGWQEGSPGTTHEFWDFTPGHIISSGVGFTADPEVVTNPQPNRVAATITPMLSGSWDGVTAITGSNWIQVALEIPNFDILNEHKELWVDIGSGVVSGITVSATDGSSTTFTYEVLPGQGDAEFGVRIVPNPYVEKIDFYVQAAAGGPEVLDYIHVDTICVPEPATIGLLTLGALIIRHAKRKQ